MLNNQYVIADSDHITESFLRVTPAKKIDDINFRELKGDFCYSDVPVYYTIPRHRKKKVFSISKLM